MILRAHGVYIILSIVSVFSQNLLLISLSQRSIHLIQSALRLQSNAV